MQKFKALVDFIISECGDPGQLGSIRLNKVLWFSDVTAYKLDGKPITREKYVKQQFGPVPVHVRQALAELEKAKHIIIQEPRFSLEPWRFVALNERFQPSSKKAKLTQGERNIAKAVLDMVLGKTANETSELSHDATWQAATMGEEIPLHATLGAPGEITDDVRDWATGVVAARTVG